MSPPPVQRPIPSMVHSSVLTPLRVILDGERSPEHVVAGSHVPAVFDPPFPVSSRGFAEVGIFLLLHGFVIP